MSEEKHDQKIDEVARIHEAFWALAKLLSQPESVTRGRSYRIEDLMRIWDCKRRKVQDDLRDLGVKTHPCGRTEHVTGDQIIDAIEGKDHGSR